MKKTLAGILFMTIFAPSLYLGMLPPKEVEAQAGLAGCMFGQLVSSAISAGLKLVQTAIGFIGLTSAIGAVSAGSGAAEAGGATAAAGATAGRADLLAVPVESVNPILGKAIGNASAGAGASALANAGSLIVDTVMSFIGADGTASTMSLLFKECVLDPLAWLFKNIVIEQITQDIISWIQGGFEGAPAFVTDPMSFMQGIGDAATGLFLFESGLDEYLCSPFQLDVIVDFYLNYSTPSFSEFGSMACTLDDVFANVGAGPNINVQVNAGYDQMARQGRISGAGGGLNAVFKSLEDQNNAYGTYFNLQSEAAARSNAIQAKENQLLIHGDGWFSMRCDLDGDGRNDNVCTPGQYISKQVDSWSDSALSQLEVADELSEIIDAVVSTLVKKVLSEVGTVGTGLLGGGDAANWASSNATQANFANTAATLRGDSINTAVGTSTPFVNTPPQPPIPFETGLTITSPANGAKFSPPDDALFYSMGNPVGVTTVEFFLSIPNPVVTVPPGPPTIVPIGQPIPRPTNVLVLNSTSLPIINSLHGTYAIFAIARNAAGQTDRSINTLRLEFP